ncbi:MAG: hypothetical protein J6X60_00830, partial [Ruminiclostridium sp.]|nr:hypothetical protein [Ruminiclostridium sp.]
LDLTVKRRLCCLVLVSEMTVTSDLPVNVRSISRSWKEVKNPGYADFLRSLRHVSAAGEILIIQRPGYICLVFKNCNLLYYTLHHQSIVFEASAFDPDSRALIGI